MKTTKRITIEQLAGMVKDGFDRIDGQFGRVYSDMNSGFADMKRGFNRVDHELSELRTDVSGILLRLTGVADQADVIHLEKRVDRIEKTIGLPN